jgi:hypothetical protein
MSFSLRYRLLKLINNTSLWWSVTLAATAATIAVLLRALSPPIILQSDNIILLSVGLPITIGFLCLFVFSRIRRSHIIGDYRKDRFRHPIKVGILDGSIRRRDRPCHVEVGALLPQQWAQILGRIFQDENLIHMISPTQIDNSYCIILNPFGEIYPEEDISRRKSFFRIKAYVEEGGIFINASGLAFYYMFDTRSGRRFITGEPLETTVEGQPGVYRGQTNPIRSWLRENFQVRVTVFHQPERLEVYQLPEDRILAGDLVNVGGTNEVNEWRACIYHPSLIPFLRSLKPRDNPNEECYPLAATKHGIGYLLLVGFTPNTAGWGDKISTAIGNMSRIIMSTGTLDLRLD